MQQKTIVRGGVVTVLQADIIPLTNDHETYLSKSTDHEGYFWNEKHFACTLHGYYRNEKEFKHGYFRNDKSRWKDSGLLCSRDSWIASKIPSTI